MEHAHKINNKLNTIADFELAARILQLQRKQRQSATREPEDLELAKLEKLQEAVTSHLPSSLSRKATQSYELIRDSHFEEYAKKLVTGALFMKLPQLVGMAKHVNWKSLSEEMKTNHDSVTFDSVMYRIQFPG